jgi:uncharacterized membrane protein YjjP (DUF1212 family)
MSQPSPDSREQNDLILNLARVLHVNGQTTDQTRVATERLGRSLGLRTKVNLHWGEIELQPEDSGTITVAFGAADPTGVHMERVVSAMRVIDEISAGQLAPSAALKTIDAISQAPPTQTWLFAVAAAAGAAALSVIFGAQHIAAVLLIAASAAIGAVMRRILAKYSTNALLAPFCAALFAGVIGALAVHYQLSSSLRLVAVCPCMILVPGPHVLNGMIDLAAVRVPLGASRLIYAGLVILAISAGLLIGLTVFNVSLPVNEPSPPVPLWLDVVAAGVAAAAFSVFFSTPLRMLGWPVAVGMLAHALRWWTLSIGATTATGALVGCLLVGLILTPVARRRQIPLAAIGFASVVSMIPGVFLFRMVSGLLQLANSSNTTLELLGGTIANGVTAIIIILAMSFGLIVPKIIIDRLTDKVARHEP